jgi:hypothetical protein
MHELKRLSIRLIQFIFPIFGLSPLNIQSLKGTVIPATRLRRARLIGTLDLVATFLPSSGKNRSYPFRTLFATRLGDPNTHDQRRIRGKLEIILLKLAKMTKLLKWPRHKCPSDQ